MLFGLSEVRLEDVKNIPEPSRLQAMFEQYLKALVPAKNPECEMGLLNEKNKLRVIGNPFEIKKEHSDSASNLHNENVPTKVGQIACKILNRAEGWDHYHLFESADTAGVFFKTCGATNKGDFMLVNAHLKNGADVVHELVHSYHGSDGRFDWLMNEGFTDWFAVDFHKSQSGRAFPYHGGKLYTRARKVADEIIGVAGKNVVGAFFFSEERNQKFQTACKGYSKLLMGMAQYEGSPDEYMKIFKKEPTQIQDGAPADAAKHLVATPKAQAESEIAAAVNKGK